MSLKTKQILIYALVAILVFSGITAAAQAFAPDNLKPFKVAKSESSSSSSSSSVSSSSVSSSSLSSVSSSYSSSSVSSSSISSSSLSSMSSTISSIASSTSTTTTVKTQTYTNQYFPDFKLVYPEDWKFETSTENSKYKNLVNRSITLTKNNHKLFVKLQPVSIVGGCGGGFSLKKEDKINENISRLTYESQDLPLYIGYGKAYNSPGSDYCYKGQYLISNLKVSNYQDYKTEVSNLSYIPNQDLIVYSYNIIVSNSNNNFELVYTDDPVVNQLDQIISQSTFK